MSVGLSIGVRPATDGDEIVLAELYESGQSAAAGERGAEIDNLLRGRHGDVEQSFVEDLADDGCHVLVAEVDGIIVGYAALSVLEPLPGEQVAELTDLFVFERARGVGAGAALLDAVLSLARSLDCRGLMARALPGDRETKNFFESLGMVARSIEVYTALD